MSIPCARLPTNCGYALYLTVALQGVIEGWKAARDWIDDKGRVNVDFLRTHFGCASVCCTEMNRSVDPLFIVCLLLCGCDVPSTQNSDVREACKQKICGSHQLVIALLLLSKLHEYV